LNGRKFGVKPYLPCSDWRLMAAAFGTEQRVDPSSPSALEGHADRESQKRQLTHLKSIRCIRGIVFPNRAKIAEVTAQPDAIVQ
jgi:hypothetical protein